MKRFNADDCYDIIEDIKRVEDTCSELVTRLATQMQIWLVLDIKTNWVRSDIPTKEHLLRIRYNVEKIAQAISSSYTINTFNDRFIYTNANDLEIALEMVQEYLDYLIKVISQPVAGFYFANEPNVLIVERS